MLGHLWKVAQRGLDDRQDQFSPGLRRVVNDRIARHGDELITHPSQLTASPQMGSQMTGEFT